MRGWTAFVVWVVLLALLAGCGNQTDDNAKETGEGGPAKEETRFVTQMVTVEETAPSDTADEPAESQGQSPEDFLALQYEYINRGDFEEAYALFAGQSQREVSLEQYRAFFEANAPYSVTDYSFSPAQIQGDSATVDAEFTVNSAAGVEQLQRNQQSVRENGDWRVVMRSEQLAAFTAAGSAADAGSTGKEASPAKEKAGAKSGQKKKAASSSKQQASTTTVTVRVEGLAGESFSGSYGNIGSQRSVDSGVPAEYNVEVETGFLTFDSVTAVMQKRSPGPWEMIIRFVVDGEVVKEQSTTAEFGVVSLNYTP